jgi:hypothetical protein
MRYLKHLTLGIMILGFFLLRPYQIQKPGLMYAGDDQAYMAHATSIAFLQFPSYEKEDFYEKGELPQPKHSIGPGLMASPFVFLGALIDRAYNSPLIQNRRVGGINSSWMVFGFGIATIIYFYLGVLFLFKGLLYHYDERTAFLSILCMIIFEIFGLYVFRRPIFSHVYEFFLQSICVYFLLTDLKTGFLEKPSGVFLGILGLIIGLIVLVRYNNVAVALMWPIVLFKFRKTPIPGGDTLKYLTTIYGIAITSVLVFALIPAYYNHAPNAYAGEVISNITSFYPLNYVVRLWDVFFGMDFGILFTAPFVLIAIGGIFLLKGTIKKQILLLLAPLLGNLYLILVWGNKSDWYGYRYILFSLIPLLVLPFAELINRIIVRYGIRIVSIFALVIAVNPIISMFGFEGNSTTLTLHISDGMWANSGYQIEMWKMILFHPSQFATAILKGIPVYIVYLVANLARHESYLPAIVLEKYTSFSVSVLVKTIFILLLPVIMYLITKKAKYQDSFR